MATHFPTSIWACLCEFPEVWLHHLCWFGTGLHVFHRRIFSHQAFILNVAFPSNDIAPAFTPKKYASKACSGIPLRCLNAVMQVFAMIVFLPGLLLRSSQVRHLCRSRFFDRCLERWRHALLISCSPVLDLIREGMPPTWPVPSFSYLQSTNSDSSYMRFYRFLTFNITDHHHAYEVGNLEPRSLSICQIIKAFVFFQNCYRSWYGGVVYLLVGVDVSCLEDTECVVVGCNWLGKGGRKPTEIDSSYSGVTLFCHWWPVDSRWPILDNWWDPGRLVMEWQHW